MGSVAYRTNTATQQQLTWFDRSGTARGTVGEAGDYDLRNPRVSPDGRRSVVHHSAPATLTSPLWLVDGSRESRFTFSVGRQDYPVWSPDGSRIAFYITKESSPGDLYLKRASGAGEEELLVHSEQIKIPTSWSADGRFLLYYNIDPQTNADLWVLPMVGDRKPWVFLKGPAREVYGAFSPDGRWVAYQSE